MLGLSYSSELSNRARTAMMSSSDFAKAFVGWSI